MQSEEVIRFEHLNDGNLMQKAPPKWIRLAVVHLADSHRFRETDTDVPGTEFLLKARRMYHQFLTRTLRRYASYALLILTWFEGPYSCEYYQGFPILCRIGLIPTHVYLIELLCVFFLFFTSTTKTFFEGLYPITRRRSFNIFVTFGSFLHIIFVFISMYEPSVSMWVLRNIMRPVYLADQFRAIRLLVAIHFKSSFKVFVPAASMLLLFVTFFSSFAQLFFGEYLDGDVTKETDIPFIKAFGNLFVMTTTTNFPDVALPAYKFNFFSFLFFSFVMIIVYFLVNRVLIAIFYDSYKMASREIADRLENHQERHIKRAFEILCEGEKHGTRRRKPSKQFTVFPNDHINIRSVIDVTAALFPHGSSNLSTIILSVLYEDEHHHVGEVSESEFINYMNCLFHVHQVTEYRLTFGPRIQLFLNWLGAPWFDPNSKLGKTLFFLLCTKWTDLFLGIIALASFMIYQFGILQRIDTFKTLKLALDIIYCIPIVVSTFVWGFKAYFWNLYNIFEFSLSMAIMSASIAYYFDQQAILFNALVCMRLITLFRALYRFSPPLKNIFIFIVNVSFVTLPNLVIIYLWMFYWAIFGTLIFGNVVVYPNEKLDELVGWNRDYYSLNFNDLGHSMTILFSYLVINNWQYIAWTYTVLMGIPSILYFGAFYLSTSFAMMNIILGFMLDAYFTLKSNEEKSHEEVEVDKYLGRIKEQLSLLPQSTPASDINGFFAFVPTKVLKTYKRGFYEAIRLFG